MRGASVGLGVDSVCWMFERAYALVQELTTGFSVAAGSVLGSGTLDLWTTFSMLKLPYVVKVSFFGASVGGGVGW